MTAVLPPHASGVYQIRCIPTGKIYVGSAVNLSKRQRDHVNSLRQGDHENVYLQRAWDKYGEENFEFTVLEFVDVSERNIGIRSTKALLILKVILLVQSRIYLHFVEKIIWILLTNLNRYCRENGLDVGSMQGVASGRIYSHRGWIYANDRRKLIPPPPKREKKIYRGFINPEGKCVIIRDLQEYCQTRGLN